MIYGNIDGIRKSILQELDSIYEFKIAKDSIFSHELVYKIGDLTKKLNREISVGIDRKGKVISVAVGDSTTVELPIIDIKENRLSGVRIVHTHPSGNPKLSALDLSALVKLKLDCMIAIGVAEESDDYGVNIGFCNLENDILTSEEIAHLSIEEAVNYDLLGKIKYVENFIKNTEIVEDSTERAILVGIESDESLDELEELAKACNVKTVYKVLQRKNRIDTALFVGSGKVEEIEMIRQAAKANLVIFDDELSGSQVRNLEQSIGVKVIDRTTLILEIFARRAKSKEAKLQVELAQLKYRLPRLMGLGTVLSRTGGGIGTRGPGEKKLETDKRHIRERVYDLRRELIKYQKNREVQRGKRNKGNIPKISLVGYTNAGKSTLRNKLCEIAPLSNGINKEKVFEANMLFATLDTTTRALQLPDNRTVTVSDTVGFVRKLPHDLVEAFKSTLEEVINSDVLLHVVDTSSESLFTQIEAVDNVLSELNAIDKDTILLLNKIDKVDEEGLKHIKERLSDKKCIEISAVEEINLDVLLKEICEILPYTLKEKSFLIPYTDQSLVAMLHRAAKVIKEEYREEGTFVTAMVDDEVFNKCKEYETEEELIDV